MSNIKDVCCNPRMHDLVLAGWPPCCATSFAFVANRFDHKKRVAWVPIFMHTCGSCFSIIMGLRSADLRVAGAPLLAIEEAALVLDCFHAGFPSPSNWNFKTLVFSAHVGRKTGEKPS